MKLVWIMDDIATVFVKLLMTMMMMMMMMYGHEVRSTSKNIITRYAISKSTL